METRTRGGEAPAVQGPAAVQGAASSSLPGNLPAIRALPTTTMARREVIAFEFWAEERGLVLHETCSEDEDARNSQPLAGLASLCQTFSEVDWAPQGR